MPKQASKRCLTLRRKRFLNETNGYDHVGIDERCESVVSYFESMDKSTKQTFWVACEKDTECNAADESVDVEQCWEEI